MEITDSMLPDCHVRSLRICPGCGSSKQVGCIVCWHCFKGRTDITPLKHYEGTLVQWLMEFKIGLLVPVIN